MAGAAGVYCLSKLQGIFGNRNWSSLHVLLRCQNRKSNANFLKPIQPLVSNRQPFSPSVSANRRCTGRFFISSALAAIKTLWEQTWTNDYDPPCSHLSIIPTITYVELPADTTANCSDMHVYPLQILWQARLTSYTALPQEDRRMI